MAGQVNYVKIGIIAFLAVVAIALVRKFVIGFESASPGGLSFTQRTCEGLEERTRDAILRACTRIITAGDAEPRALAMAYRQRGVALYQIGNNLAAARDLTRAIKILPDEPGLRFSRGIIYEALNQRDEAIADLRFALRSEPDNEDIRDALKRLGAAP